MYVSDFAGGALHWLGTEGGTREYQNPQATEAVAVTASSEDNGSSYHAAPRLVQHRPGGKINSTQNKPNSRMALALGGGAKIEVAHYCPRHGDNYTNGCYRLRHWDLEASLLAGRAGLDHAALAPRRSVAARIRVLDGGMGFGGRQGRVLALRTSASARRARTAVGSTTCAAPAASCPASSCTKCCTRRSSETRVKRSSNQLPF
jgi:hypothetical protein